jgi:hypothetical protein
MGEFKNGEEEHEPVSAKDAYFPVGIVQKLIKGWLIDDTEPTDLLKGEISPAGGGIADTEFM